MANQIPRELLDQFFLLAEKGDEAAARKFLTDNLKQFPEETQDAIITAFVEEALAKQTQEQAAIAGFQKQGVETVNALEKAKEELEKKLKMAEIKESL
jgi:hypothetical protein